MALSTEPSLMKVRRIGARTEIDVSGRIDSASAPAVDVEISRALHDALETLVLDLHNADFIDSSVAHLLVKAHGDAQTHGVALIVIPPAGAASGAFEFCGLDELLRVVQAPPLPRPQGKSDFVTDWSDDHAVEPTNAAIKGRHKRISAAANVRKDNQTIVDADQTSADLDQTSADRGQSASDQDLVHGGDRLVRESSRDSRQRSTHAREEGTAGRLWVASRRDAGAHQRDVGADARDEAADARDLAMTQRDAASEHADGRRVVTGAEIVLRAAERRKSATRERVQAAETRVLAAQDRRSARDDREQADSDRLQARGDRDALAAALVIAGTDALTGVHARAAGLTNLDREIDRCRRNNGQLVVTYIDVVSLKASNDSKDHAAGDELLKRVVTLIRAHLRTYDLIIRLGGDALLCAMSSMTVAKACQRFSDVATLLTTSGDAGAIRVGVAELTPNDTVTDLIARADNELLDQRNAADQR